MGDQRAGVVDRDEYGEPVAESMRRLGAGRDRENEAGLYVRFEPGFGLNVHVGIRKAIYDRPPGVYGGREPSHYEDNDGLVLAIGGWERLCELVDEYRAMQGER